MRLSSRTVTSLLGIVLALQAMNVGSLLLSFVIARLIYWRVPGWAAPLGALAIIAIVVGAGLIIRMPALGRWIAGAGLAAAAVMFVGVFAAVSRPSTALVGGLYLAATIALSAIGIALLTRWKPQSDADN